ncbi:hypothetical protein CYLTODRAFT_417856 [Cylindrobasidium torrendii FP15055 ss-10]|uniref:DUF2415 domain-containing protein n=1 Tax=Cylindrobasidium torrendii FP15055 ss-10 TaxID=1314674 RepID=A0A0D7BPU8_9AGAR|nr:hypothetical protein CYLTODRAFT_417856 [Cylindrobasidium torrendii FP15055 ss-10]
MAREAPHLTSSKPTTIASASVHIGHVQLRDLVVCPRERGIVNYVRHNSIVEHNILEPQSMPYKLAKLKFIPNTLTSMAVPGTDSILLAAGGQDAEIHLSCYAPSPQSHSRPHWQFHDRIRGSINNSLLLTSLNMSQSHESSAEPRVVVSNNDGTVRFFDVPIRAEYTSAHLCEAGAVQLNVAINHSSISPDGRTLLSVGDSSKVFLHRLTGGSHVNISPISTMPIPSPDTPSLPYSANGALVASFSTAFSSDGTKYAVASQEGVVAVWDVRSSKPMKTFNTDKTRISLGHGGATGWLSDDPWDWTRNSYRAPGWSVRSVKFNNSGRYGTGKEIMTFTEHTSLLHVVDARTFETEEVIRVPQCPPTEATPPPAPPPPLRPHAARRRLLYTTNTPRPSTGMVTPPYDSARSPSPDVFRSTMAALEDTFRIPSSSPSSRRRSSRRTTPAVPDDSDDLVVIPPLGDRDVELDVHTLLGRHGIRTRPPHASEGADEHHLEYYRRRASTEDPEGEAMEVDELERECVTPSRSTSPSPSANIGGGMSTRFPTFSPPARTIARAEERQREREANLDIAGVCFDPSGKWIYVATTESVSEWSIKDGEKRWWVDNEWA